MLQLGSLREIECTYEELQEGIPKEPIGAKMDLAVEEFVGRELDPVIKQASDELLADDSFVKIGAFLQFVWRKYIGQFKERCKKGKVEQPHKDASTVEAEIKQEMLREFEAITPEQGRKLIADAGVLILPEWDIADALIFDVVRKETKPLEGITFNNGHATLVIWSLKRE